MKEYRQAFDNIKVPDDMVSRIEKELAETPAEITPISPARKGRKVWVTFAALAACCALIVGVWKLGGPGWQPQIGAPEPAATQSGSTSRPQTTPAVTAGDPGGQPQTTAAPTKGPGGTAGQTQITPAPSDDQGVAVVNPIQAVESTGELAKYLGYAPALPTNVPEGYSVSSCTVIDGKLAEVNYSSGESEVSYRTARGSDDVSGDYNEYPETAVSGAYTLRGADGAVSLVVWTDGVSSFSLSFSPAVPDSDALAWAKSVK